MTDRLMNAITVGILAVSVYIAFPAIRVRLMGPPQSASTVDTSGTLRQRVDSLWLMDVSGGAKAVDIGRSPGVTLVYMFTTTCPFCESQKKEVGQLLSHLAERGARVITMSPEAPSVIASYWRDDVPTLAPPTTILPWSLQSLGAVSVPQLYVIADGAIQRSFKGVMSGDTYRVLNELIEDLL